MSKFVDLPPVWLGLFAALAWGQSRLLPMNMFGTFGDVAGGVLVVAGIGLALLAVREFARARTTVIPHQQPSALVSSGIFRLSRNPIYLGDAFILLGLVLWWDAVLSLVLVPAFMALIQARFIRAEEARLEAAFPEAFADYSARVARWFGRQ
ncbi:methyltransferase family protein [Ovoidimarina sediminis]|uniref:methyltransferase family protein n=1 Tax=Ovoidimarina sediminis TaxID=3079856 RepID=UPI00290AC82E|nr:isoprenylcysteine carboxylmethyltransferase family protein [Rhodophyticola sp. MJ-SS7]MDU8944855.1 isoprenylcysteine carboxylmethyltransferase family protein [Rhodophyticola sp. MJ-SS7]